MCASHNGEDIHVKTAESMLKKIGYDTSYYECGTHFPYDKESKIKLIQNDEKASALHNNCSGKHAGMLCLAKHLQVDPKGYTDSNHPVQQLIMEQVKRFSELDEFPLAIDGCSAPVPFLPLFNIALMYQKFAGRNYDELNTLFDAIISNPYLIAGQDRFDTDFIKAMAGNAVTKVGGEGVRGVGIRTAKGETYGVALKVLDGNQRCNPIATLAVLEDMELLTDDELVKLSTYKKIVLQNHRKIETGSIKVEL
jgi:L-asparaginase II